MRLTTLFLAAISCTMLNAMTVCLRPDNRLTIRSSWSKTDDLLRVCNLGQNGQFNFVASGLVSKKASDEDVLLKEKFRWKFHICSDAVGVMYIYPDPAKPNLNILSGNHGFGGTIVTLPDHGYTEADVGKKLGKNHWIARVDSASEFTVLPAADKKMFPKTAKLRSSGNFKATRIINRRYLLDGKELVPGKIMKGKELVVVEKNGICRFDALANAKFKHENVSDFYAVYDIGYNFFSNGCCRIDSKITFPGEICIRSINPVQDHDLHIPGGYFYEKYIPKLKPIREKPEYSFRSARPPQVFHRPQKKRVVDTRAYDFAAIQDLTAIRRMPATTAPRFEIKVKGGYVDPADQPDRFIDLIGKKVKGKKMRLAGNVLGIDTDYGIARKNERAKNQSSFVLASWHKTYITQFGQNKTVLKPGTVLTSVGYRAYFNPQNIGEATVLYTIPFPDGEKIYVDFHQDVKDYILPFAAGAKVRVVEKSPGTTLNGNKISVSGGYGFAVIFVQKAKQSKP